MKQPTRWIAGFVGSICFAAGFFWCELITFVPPHHRTALRLAIVLEGVAVVCFAWELILARTIGRFLISAMGIGGAGLLIWHCGSRLAFLLRSGM